MCVCVLEHGRINMREVCVCVYVCVFVCPGRALLMRAVVMCVCVCVCDVCVCVVVFCVCERFCVVAC